MSVSRYVLRACHPNGNHSQELMLCCAVPHLHRGVGRFFRSATKAASSYLKEVSAAAVAAPPDASVVMNLQSIAMDLSSPFEPTHPPHEALLARLWVAAYGGEG